MSNGCVLIGSNAIGSIPYLLVDGSNGLVFESCNLDSLCEKVKYLLTILKNFIGFLEMV